MSNAAEICPAIFTRDVVRDVEYKDVEFLFN